MEATLTFELKKHNFIEVPIGLSLNDDLENNIAKDYLDIFKYRIKTKIIRDKEAYLLHKLLKDIKFLSVE